MVIWSVSKQYANVFMIHIPHSLTIIIFLPTYPTCSHAAAILTSAFTNLLHGCATQSKLPLKTSRDYEIPKNAPRRKKYNHANRYKSKDKCFATIKHSLFNQSKLYFNNRGNSNNKYFTTIRNFKTLIIQQIE